jgi:hypothetical protein
MAAFRALLGMTTVSMRRPQATNRAARGLVERAENTAICLIVKGKSRWFHMHLISYLHSMREKA